MATDILVVDDEIDIRGLIADILRDEGYDVVEAASFDEARSLLSSRQPGLLITELKLGLYVHNLLDEEILPTPLSLLPSGLTPQASSLPPSPRCRFTRNIL